MNPGTSIAGVRRPALASDIDNIFDVLDVLFALIELFNAILEAIRNFGDFLNGL